MSEVDRGIKVMVVEDEGGTRDALGALLRENPGFACTGLYRTARRALEAIPAERPRVILVDLNLPGMSGVEFIRLCRQKYPEVELLVLTVHDEAEYVFPALSSGASGYLVKGIPPDRVLRAIQEVAAGGASMTGQVARMVLKTLRPSSPGASAFPGLSTREVEVLGLLAEGLRYDEIAVRLSLSVRTVNSHLQRIYRKLHVHSATAAVARLHESRKRAG
jgi:DNA-binding NarL/FixJ family response regulator